MPSRYLALAGEPVNIMIIIVGSVSTTQQLFGMMQQCMQAFKEHPDKPSQARCEELAQAWHDAYTPQAPDR